MHCITHIDVAACCLPRPQVQLQDYRYVWLFDDSVDLAELNNLIDKIAKNKQDGQLLTTEDCVELSPAKAKDFVGVSKRFKSYTKVKCDVRSNNAEECSHSGAFETNFGLHRLGMTLLDEVDQCSLKYVTGLGDLSACSIAHAAELTVGKILSLSEIFGLIAAGQDPLEKFGEDLNLHMKKN